MNSKALHELMQSVNLWIVQNADADAAAGWQQSYSFIKQLSKRNKHREMEQVNVNK